MVMVIPPDREPLGPHGVRYEEEGIVRRIVTAILADHGPHGAGYGESGVASSGGHIVRFCRLLQTDAIIHLEEFGLVGSGGSAIEKFGGARPQKSSTD